MSALIIYMTLLIGFLGGFVTAWIVLSCKAAKVVQNNISFQLALLERLEEAYPTALPESDPENNR